jgi:hypothetical protein
VVFGLSSGEPRDSPAIICHPKNVVRQSLTGNPQTSLRLELAPAARPATTLLMATAERDAVGRLMPKPFHRSLTIILWAILLAPSLWMLAEIPPLWRDVDAYNQVTFSVPKAIHAGHGALYCLAARVPLYLGYKFDSVRQNRVSAARPRLTDSGVFLLVLAQHVGFAGAGFFLIVTAARSPWTRIILGLACAGSPVFYTVAHCIGSEALSLICTLLLAASGLRVMCRMGQERGREWLLFSFLLLLCLLTRYVNFWLVTVLPLSFLVTALQEHLRALAGHKMAPLLRKSAGEHLRQTGFALVVGLSVLIATNGVNHLICRSARLNYHSHAGHTFLWRLSFLRSLSPSQRDDLLDRVANRSHSAVVRKLLSLIGQTFREGGSLTTEAFLEEARARLFAPQIKHPKEKLDLALNEMVFAFLFPPPPEYLRAVRADFAHARQTPLRDVIDFFFATTAYYFYHPNTMPACSSLSSFRETDARAISAIPSRHPYFQFGGNLTYNSCFLAWLATVLLLALLKRETLDCGAILSYSITLVSVGLLMMISTCLLGALLPRYVLPMWQMLIASWCITIGALLDHVLGVERWRESQEGAVAG